MKQVDREHAIQRKRVKRVADFCRLLSVLFRHYPDEGSTNLIRYVIIIA